MKELPNIKDDDLHSQHLLLDEESTQGEDVSLFSGKFLFGYRKDLRQNRSDSLKLSLMFVCISWAITIISLMYSLKQGAVIKCSGAESYIEEKVGLLQAPNFPLKEVTFIKDERYMGPLNESKDAWSEIFDIANGGRVTLDDDSSNFLGVSGFHQVHCTYYFVQAIDMAIEGIKPNDHLSKHMAHCAEFLRQSAMCFADPTLERPFEGVLGSFEARTTHLCRDYGKLVEWANENAYRGD